MYFAELWNILHNAHATIHEVSLETQADVINTLFLFLQKRSSSLYPSLLCEQIINILNYYLTDILPKQGYNDDDAVFIAAEYRALLAQVRKSLTQVTYCERAFEQILYRLQHEEYADAGSVADDVVRIVFEHHNAESLRLNLQGKQLQKSFDRVQKTYNVAHVSQFFICLFDLLSETSEAWTSPLAAVRPVFEYALNVYFQGKALLVDSFFQGCVMPIWVMVDTSRTSAHVEFANQHIDADMQMSADIARIVARQYLIQLMGSDLSEHIAVQCWFPNPAASYHDASLSLLIGLKIVGEVLGLDVDPSTVVTGEIDRFGQICSVEYLPQKMQAASAHRGITRMLAPEYDHDAILPPSRLPFTLFTVRNFSKALDLYYGPQLQHNAHRISPNRRKFLFGVGGAGILAGSLVLAGIKAVPAYSLKTQDIEQCTWNIEYATVLYERQDERAKAQKILQSVIRSIDRHTSTEALRIKAFALEELGWSYMAQHRKNTVLRKLQEAYKLWKDLDNPEKQAHLLLLMGAVFGDAGPQNAIRQNSKQAFCYLDAANDLLTSSMKTFYALKSRYYSRLGVLYYWLGEYELAADYAQKGVELFHEFDTSTNPYFQANRQHLGRVLIQLQEYDRAYDLIQSTANSPLLQSFNNQARSFRTFSDFFFATGDFDKGLEFAQRTADLCNTYGLTIQKIGIQQVLTRYGFPGSIITLV